MCGVCDATYFIVLDGVCGLITNSLFLHEFSFYAAHEVQKLAKHKLVGVPIVRDHIQFLSSMRLISPNCHEIVFTISICREKIILSFSVDRVM